MSIRQGVYHGTARFVNNFHEGRPHRRDGVRREPGGWDAGDGGDRVRRGAGDAGGFGRRARTGVPRPARAGAPAAAAPHQSPGQRRRPPEPRRRGRVRHRRRRLAAARGGPWRLRGAGRLSGLHQTWPADVF